MCNINAISIHDSYLEKVEFIIPGSMMLKIRNAYKYKYNNEVDMNNNEFFGYENFDMIIYIENISKLFIDIKDVDEYTSIYDCDLYVGGSQMFRFDTRKYLNTKICIELSLGGKIEVESETINFYDSSKSSVSESP